MQIAGEWLVGRDGVIRPIVWVWVRGADGGPREEPFLVDTGADRTILRAELWQSLRLQSVPVASGGFLHGIGGMNRFVVVSAMIQLPRSDGPPVELEAPFAGSNEPQALDNSLLGRDVLNHFDLVLSRPRGEILLLAGTHRYTVTQV
jgi:hypothetical protein